MSRPVPRSGSSGDATLTSIQEAVEVERAASACAGERKETEGRPHYPNHPRHLRPTLFLGSWNSARSSTRLRAWNRCSTCHNKIGH